MLENIYKAAFRAADHGLLKPWRFLEIRQDSRQRLGELFVEAAKQDNPDISEIQQEKLRKKPLRAPLIIVTICSYQDHPKVPQFEQELCVAAATQNMLLACHAQNIGAMWRTGALVYHPVVTAGLGLSKNEKVIGLLYLGTNDCPARPVDTPDLNNFVKDW